MSAYAKGYRAGREWARCEASMEALGAIYDLFIRDLTKDRNRCIAMWQRIKYEVRGSAEFYDLANKSSDYQEAWYQGVCDVASDFFPKTLDEGR